MKKLLSLLLVCMCAFSAMALEKTFTASPDLVNGTVDGFTFLAEKNNGTTAPTYNANGQDVRIYAKGTYKITNNSGTNMTNIVFNISAQGKKRLAAISCNAGAVATQAVGDETVTWNGASQTVTFTVGDQAVYGSDGESKAGQLDFSSLVITYEDGGTITIPAPTFNPAGGTFYAPVNVEITGAIGATFYYTTDGNDPTTSSAVYSAPINISQNTTLKAIAVTEDATSPVATATYTFESVNSVPNIAAYYALGVGAFAAISNPVTVYYSNGNYVWVKDDTGYLLIFGRNAGNMHYENGDIIPGGFGGYLKEYNGGPEMTFEGDQDLFGFQEATIHGDAIAPEVVTTANVSTDIWGHYVEIKKATVSDVNNKNFNINDAAGTLAGYNGMNITLPTDLEVEYNITGIVASHNNNVQLLPSNFEKIINIDDLSTVDNIAALLATAEGTDVKISNPVTVVYQNGENLYIQDESAWTLVFGQLDNTYNNGDILTGIAGSWKTYYQIIEMIPLAESFGEATPGTAVEPEVLAIEELSTNLVHKFIKIDNCAMTKVDDVNYNLNDETGDLTMYLKFNGVTAPEDLTATYNVSGFLTLYKPKDAETAIMEFYPVEFEKVGGEPQPVPGDVNGDGEVTGSDVTALYNHILFGQDTEIFNGDQNGDGEVTGSDVTAVYNIILGL